MVRLKVPRSAVCQKPGCGGSFTHRHHKGHQKHVLNWFKDYQPGAKFTKWLEKRYKQYRDDECVNLCPGHHAEIHWIYKPYIRWFYEELYKNHKRYSSDMTPKDARALLKLLSDLCDEWLKTRTPAIDPAHFGWGQHFSDIGDFDVR
jgi:hypothetical protein